MSRDFIRLNTCLVDNYHVTMCSVRAITAGTNCDVSQIRQTYCIRVGEIPCVSQPAAQMVVRASPAGKK